MNKLKDTIAYILLNYPTAFRSELSKARLTKIIYLSDWKYAIQYGKTITNIQWIYNHFGPYVDDVINTIIRYPKEFRIRRTYNIFRKNKELIELERKDLEILNLSSSEKKTINFVIRATAGLSWKDFIDLVYSTYPIVTQDKMSNLDLIELSHNYKKEEAFKVNS